MKTVEIIVYRRANLSKNDAQKVREEGHVPCVLYGGDTQVHFYAPVILFRDLVYTNEAHFVHLNIEGEECQAIMQEVQFHPVSEIILHVDFLRISEDRKIKIEKLEVLDPKAAAIASVEVPRAAKLAEETAAAAPAEGAAAAGAAPAA